MAGFPLFTLLSGNLSVAVLGFKNKTEEDLEGISDLPVKNVQSAVIPLALYHDCFHKSNVPQFLMPYKVKMPVFEGVF